jgi:2-polyprenyl-6-methoxyphenol hydroxylase-like FAD-dependent oxidoreductase
MEENESLGKKKIAIIGLGIGGLTLAYAFSKSNLFDLKIFTTHDAEDIRNGRIPSTQVHFHKLLQTESRYDIPDYGNVNELKQMELLINGQKMFKGNLASRAISVDQRIYLSALIDGLHQIGADIQKSRISSTVMTKLAEEFDLIIDCTGKIGPIAPFPIYEDMKPSPQTPLRVCSAGFFNGLEPDEANKFSFHIVPGLAEMFELSTITKHGLSRTLLLEVVPGCEVDQIRGDKGPQVFTEIMRRILETYFPHIFDRVNVDRFRLVDDLAYTRMAIKPEVRIPYTIMHGTLVIGCGDSVALNDPITGQGANVASHCADVLYNTVVENRNELWDISLGIKYWNEINEYVTKVSEWTNAMMGPMTESFSKMLGIATQHQETADEFANMFTDPIKAHGAFFKS